MPVDVKTIGSSGQISLGKEYAGQLVTVAQVEDGVWVVKRAQVIPENEMWLHQSPVREDLQAAIRWAEQNPPKETSLDELEAKVRRRRLLPSRHPNHRASHCGETN